MKILIINGPNLNLIGKRETDIYGTQTFDDYFIFLETKYPKINFEYFQSNSEGEIIDKLQQNGFSDNKIILNAGAYTHTSIAIADAIAGITAPVIEVHISNIFAREDFRHKSFIAPHCKGSISGFGLNSYRLAVEYYNAANDNSELGIKN